MKGFAMSSTSLPGSVISHVSLGTNDYGRAKAFYDAVLTTLQVRCVMDFPGGAGYGRQFPEFWIQTPHDGGRAGVANGVHVSFLANSIDEVKAFHAKALELGGKDDGAPGYRAEYTPGYYAAFVRDLDGHKIEAMLMTEPPRG
jgi:catechol 2,3-dioxygenase-like lactoylglutathione lyase family enzyme